MSAEPVVLRIRPTAALSVPAPDVQNRRLLAPDPLVVLGAERVPPLVLGGVRPARHTCFGPRGAVLVDRDGPLFIADTGHHRLLGFRARPERDQASADWVIGQPDFESEGRNAGGPVTATSLNVPTGLCRVGAGLAVADAWNHRVLYWKIAPRASNTPPDAVLGQPDFTSGAPNRGRGAPSADGFHWPYGVACIEGRLLVADSKNRRVLVWNDSATLESGQPADSVLGQTRFEDGDENAGGAPSAASMRWPHGICAWRGRLCVADAGNNRVMVWRGMPAESGQPADFVLGQSSPELVDHNQSLYWPRANTLNMPYALTALGDWLVVADTASSRLLGWHIDDLATGSAARALAGQHDFHQKGDNRWQAASADSFCWPYGIDALDNLLLVADSGNNRVSLWEVDP